MKMKLTSGQFGEIEFEESAVLHIGEGVIGFEHLKRFLFIENDSVFNWLLSVDEPEIIFPLFPIRFLYSDYPEIEGHEPFGIVRLHKNPEQITVNLKAPLYFMMDAKKGFQKILDNDTYKIDYNLFVKEN